VKQPKEDRNGIAGSQEGGPDRGDRHPYRHDPDPAGTSGPHAAAASVCGHVGRRPEHGRQHHGQPAATVDSTASNQPPHIPTPPGTAFQKAPANKATIKVGSASVKISGKAAARSTDPAATCNDPVDLPVGKVIAVGTVFIG
jgi:uncharacterized Zn-binding protein involved in type VI secretion